MSRILFIGSSTYASGAEGVVARLIQSLSSRHIVFCALPWTDNNRAWRRTMTDYCELVDGSLLAERIEGRYQRPGWTVLLRQMIWTWRLIRRVKPDLVFFWLHLPMAGLGPMLTATLSRSCVAVMYQLVNGPLGLGRRRRKLGRWMLSRHRAWVAVSENNRRLLADSYQVAERDITVIYNGVDTRFGEVQEPDAIRMERARWNIQPEDTLFLYIGSLHSAKGCRLLVQAAVALRTMHPHLHLLLVGEGPDRVYLENLIAERDAASFIHLPGKIQNVIPVLAAADVFVLPSHAEGFSLALLEAMQAGLPAIATAASSMPEAVRSESEGLLFNQDDGASLLTAMWRMLDADLRKQCGEKAKERARSFDARRMDREYDDLINKILAD